MFYVNVTRKSQESAPKTTFSQINRIHILPEKTPPFLKVILETKTTGSRLGWQSCLLGHIKASLLRPLNISLYGIPHPDYLWPYRYHAPIKRSVPPIHLSMLPVYVKLPVRKPHTLIVNPSNYLQPFNRPHHHALIPMYSQLLYT